MENRIKGHIFAIITITIWSSTFIISKYLLKDLSPLQILFLRFIISTVFLSIIYPKFKKPICLKEELLFFLSGLCLALYFVFENTALIHTYSSNVSLITSTIPLITGALSVLFYRKNFFTKYSILGFILAYAGVFLIIINGNKLMGVEPVGDLYALSAAFMFATYTLTMQKISKNYHLIELTRKVMFYGLGVLGIIMLILGESINIKEISIRNLTFLFYLGIVASSLAFLMWNKAINIISSIKTNQYIYLVPVITTLLSAILINEKITIITITGTCLIIAGLVIAEKKPKKQDFNEIVN